MGYSPWGRRVCRDWACSQRFHTPLASPSAGPGSCHSFISKDLRLLGTMPSLGTTPIITCSLGALGYLLHPRHTSPAPIMEQQHALPVILLPALLLLS